MPAIGFETRLARLERELSPRMDRYEVRTYSGDDLPPYEGTLIPIYVKIYVPEVTEDKALEWASQYLDDRQSDPLAGQVG